MFDCLKQKHKNDGTSIQKILLFLGIPLNILI